MSTEGIAGEELAELPGSHRNRADISGTLIDAPADDVVRVTIVLRRRNELPAETMHGRERLSRAEFASRHGADPADIERVQAFAQRSDLRVVQTDTASRRVQVEGSVAALQRAFGVRLQTVAGGTLRVREGSIMIPASLQGVILGVFGLDNRPQASPHFFVPADATPADIRPADYTATDLAALYNFPSGVNGSGQTIGILELGGGYRQTDLDGYFGSLGLATPSVTSVSVDGAVNAPGSNSDGEVALDIEVAGGCAPGANIVVYFAPNSGQGFLDAAFTAVHDQTNHPSVISISWGGAESGWTDQGMQVMDQIFADAGVLGISVFVAAGDHGSGDDVKDNLAHVDFPASCPNATACGGTHLDSSGNTITNEVAWNNNNDWATGGGISDQFALPAWQQNAGVPASVNPGNRVGRGVPDVAGAADGSPGFRIYLNGGFTTTGGTSGVAPLWAGLTALINEALGRDIGGLNPQIYGRQAGLGGFRDVTAGNNGAYAAGPGWDACTGLGSPDGKALLAALRGPYPMTWRGMTNTAEFGNMNDGHHRFLVGDFAGRGYAQVLFYYEGDGNWWLGDFAGGGWQLMSNTAVFGDLNDSQHLMWSGDFTGKGRDQVLFYYNGDGNWWLGDFADGGWQLIGNSAGFGNLNDGHHRFFVGDYAGRGYAQMLIFYEGDGNWYLGDFAGGGWQEMSNTAVYGDLNDGSHQMWSGDFTGKGHDQVLFYYNGDGNWFLGDFAGGGWQLIGNTAGFGNLKDGQHVFWTGELTGPGEVQMLFYDAFDSYWWLGAIAS